MGFVCLYWGQPSECHECGGWAGQDPLDGRFCSEGCADSYAANLTRMEQAQTERRRAEDEFAAQVAQLRERGFSYEEIDDILAEVPS